MKYAIEGWDDYTDGKEVNILPSLATFFEQVSGKGVTEVNERQWTYDVYGKGDHQSIL